MAYVNVKLITSVRPCMPFSADTSIPSFCRKAIPICFVSAHNKEITVILHHHNLSAASPLPQWITAAANAFDLLSAMKGSCGETEWGH